MTSTTRVVLGAILGALAWAGLAALLPSLPPSIRFLSSWLLLTFGPGAAVGVWLTWDLDPLRRVIVLLGFGSAACAVAIDTLGRVQLLAAYPYLAAALAGAGLAAWRARSAGSRGRTSRGDLIACLVIVGLAAGTGAVAFEHRLVATPDQILVYGNYDSLDLTYYASISAEASHTVPPTASYYSGHQLNYAYFPQLVLAMVHRFARLPTLTIYFKYAWPAFLSLGALTAFVLVRSLAPTGTSLLAVALMLVCGDFSYLAAWLLPHATVQWDYLLWPTNFLAPTMEVLHFNSWTPSLPVFFTALFAIVRGLQTRSRWWMLASALLIAVLFQFKPFAFVVLLAGLFAAAVFTDDDGMALRRFAETIGLGVLFALPFVYRSIALYSDRRSELRLDYFRLPRQMLIKLDLTDQFQAAADRLMPVASLREGLVLVLATIVFLAVGPGIRWLGVPGVWRALRAEEGPDASSWRLLAWTAVAGVAIPFAVVTEPYNDTLQFYQTGLYLLWIFTALALGSLARARPAVGAAAIVLAAAIALPSSFHYLAMKWTDSERPPLVGLSSSEITIANLLRTGDAETTVVLHDRPSDPSLMTVLSERRVVLGWARYAVGSDDRRMDVDRFFGSVSGDPAAALDVLRRYKVTHVVEHPGRDRIHGDVLARLRPVLRFPDAVLYEVPAGL